MRHAFLEAQARLRGIQRESGTYDVDEARATVATLAKALEQTISTINAIDNLPAQRLYSVGMQPVSGVDRGRINNEIVRLAHALHLR